MALSKFSKILAGLTILSNFAMTSALAQTADRLLVSYGGYNETAAPMWVGIEKGIFKKYGIDASMIQVRSGALSVAALIAKEVDVVGPHSRPSSARCRVASS